MPSRLTASLIVKNELSRYLELSIPALTAFCNDVVVVDDNSTDGTREFLQSEAGVTCFPLENGSFFEHEGRARQFLVDKTVELGAELILAIDADEFVSDPVELRRQFDSVGGVNVFRLVMEEVWAADEDALYIREDNLWRAHPVPVVWRVQESVPWLPLIEDRALACGRIPAIAHNLPAVHVDSSLLHFGWTCKSTRQARYDRYAVADGGKFHASQHLESIMWPDSAVELRRRSWPEALLPYKAEILAKVAS